MEEGDRICGKRLKALLSDTGLGREHGAAGHLELGQLMKSRILLISGASMD